MKNLHRDVRTMSEAHQSQLTALIHLATKIDRPRHGLILKIVYHLMGCSRPALAELLRTVKGVKSCRRKKTIHALRAVRKVIKSDHADTVFAVSLREVLDECY